MASVGKTLVVASIAAGALAALAHASAFSAWSGAVSVEARQGTSSSLNTAALEGCPGVSKDGLSLYFASNRTGGVGGLDIWIATRVVASDPWGDPVNAGAPVNTAADEFCPSPGRNGHSLLFVSTKSGGCGLADIYRTRQHAKRGWAAPENLGCGVNSAAGEASPSVVGGELYFSSNRAGGYSSSGDGAVTGDADVYVAPIDEEGVVGTPVPAPGLNTEKNDARPNVRRDGREIFFDSNRPGWIGSTVNVDLYSATRASTAGAWSTPVNLGALVNSSAADDRASLSWDGTALYFGSARAGGEGSSDLYVTTRERVPASG